MGFGSKLDTLPLIRARAPFQFNLTKLPAVSREKNISNFADYQNPVELRKKIINKELTFNAIFEQTNHSERVNQNEREREEVITYKCQNIRSKFMFFWWKSITFQPVSVSSNEKSGRLFRKIRSKIQLHFDCVCVW